MTKISPKPKKMIEIPRNLENDRNTSETYKMTKIPVNL